jgi:hypothetical protein
MNEKVYKRIYKMYSELGLDVTDLKLLFDNQDNVLSLTNYINKNNVSDYESERIQKLKKEYVNFTGKATNIDLKESRIYKIFWERFENLYLPKLMAHQFFLSKSDFEFYIFNKLKSPIYELNYNYFFEENKEIEINDKTIKINLKIDFDIPKVEFEKIINNYLKLDNVYNVLFYGDKNYYLYYLTSLFTKNNTTNKNKAKFLYQSKNFISGFEIEAFKKYVSVITPSEETQNMTIDDDDFPSVDIKEEYIKLLNTII